ncbi:winged helix-turn-helix transcriptional regulator [Anaerobacillus sp. CMMVII]|uniref:MarR family winged helix-turn-helix transcriptional regulator n=1 Tax=Anaerobacillus sp. CMMVII TaxID=2755588 RepID=UPI0021B763EA|nr:MarR family winged helix-turn-helix transcriptional regulator [Anaerobacillus sp. CMMVII]MCT8139456.1 winged helix-turn-helix transcriptional regulator [Anaerobacillus sp. CMMVII]
MENIRELFQILTRRFGFLNKNCCSIGEFEISMIHSHILFEVERRNKPSMQEVAEALGTDITTFSRQIQTLVKMELVEKTPHEEDRRVQLLSLTTQGKFVTGAIDQQMKDYLEEIFSHLGADEREMVIQSIKLLNEAMAKSSRCCQPNMF